MTARMSVSMAAKILGRKPSEVRRCLENQGWASGSHATLEGQRAGVVTMEDEQMVFSSGPTKRYRVMRVTGKGLDLLSRCLERYAA